MSSQPWVNSGLHLFCIVCIVSSLIQKRDYDIGYLNNAIIPPSEDTLSPISVDESTA